MRPTVPILLLMLLMALPGSGLASLAGSIVELGEPEPVDPCDSVEFEFFVYNGSPDSEWIQNLSFRFPECHTITGGRYDDFDAGWSFQFTSLGNQALFEDADGGHGEIRGDEGGFFYVTALIGCDCECGDQQLAWSLEGDGWGEAPHELAWTLGYRLCETATQDLGSWSTLKSLYRD